MNRVFRRDQTTIGCGATDANAELLRDCATGCALTQRSSYETLISRRRLATREGWPSLAANVGEAAVYIVNSQP